MHPSRAALLIVIALTACGEGHSALAITRPLSTGDPSCPTGGTVLESGLDTNRDGELDPNEVTSTNYLCNGTAATRTRLLVKTGTVPAGDAGCPFGGYRIESGEDTNQDGVLDPDEVISTSNVCNAQQAAVIVDVTALPAGDLSCPHGGYQIDSGLDSNANNALDADEITATSYICETDPAFLTSTTELPIGDSHCSNGGHRVESGIDVNANGALDLEEIATTNYLCNDGPLIATPISNTQIDLDWSALAASPAVDSYEIYMDQAWLESIYDASIWEYSVTGLAQGAAYRFMVVGLDSELFPVFASPEVSATTLGPHPWRPTSMVNAPSAGRYEGVWAGSRMIVWRWDDTGRTYDPATDTWTPMSTLRAPPPRYGHTSLAAGTKMILWGGESSRAWHNDGAIYDVTTDTWTRMTNAYPPEPRRRHTAVWTGSQMIVWGGTQKIGRQPRIIYDTGGVYDPATDTWRPTSTINAPPPMRGHEAVWTGTRMIVWGGRIGGIYDPTTDTWTTMAADGPAKLGGVGTAVWTGSTMVAWGGYWEPVGIGGIYDPVTDSWKPTSMTNAPCSGPHTAVWSGTEMIVWCGSETNTGGIYNPATDTWRRIVNTGGAPQTREDHGAVWTGTKMIVWGGVKPETTLFLATGGGFSPPR